MWRGRGAWADNPGVARRVACSLLLFVATSLATRALFMGVPTLDLDEAAHLVGSQVLLGGGRLYTDFVDNKPPLLYVYYAAAQILLGPGLLSVRLLTAALTIPLTALALSAFFGHGRRGRIAGLLYVVYGAAFLAHDMHAAHAEILMLLPAAWALCLVRDPGAGALRGLAAGALLGGAVLLKHTAAAWGAAFALHLVLGERGLKARVTAVSAFAAGFFAPLAAVWIVFSLNGGAADLLYWNWTWNLTYAGNPITGAEAAVRAGRSGLPFVLSVVPLVVAARRGARGLAPHESRLLLLVLACSLPIALVGLRFFPHYFIPFYVPLALLAAPQVDDWTSPLSAPGRRFLIATAAMLAGFTALNAWLYFRSDVYAEARPVYAQVAARLRADPCFREDSSVFVWGYAPMFYTAAGLRPASRFVVPQVSLTGYLAGNTAAARGEIDTTAFIQPGHWDLLLSDLERSRPLYVLDTAPSGLYRWNRYPVADFPRLSTWLASGYEAVGSVSGVRVLRRLGCDVVPAAH